MPPEQAEAYAELMAENFVFNLETLATKDYLDASLRDVTSRIRILFWMNAAILTVAVLPQLNLWAG